MINFYDVTKKNKKKIQWHNPNWSQISDHPHIILIIGGSGCGKTNLLFNLISQQKHIEKTYILKIHTM